MRTNKNFYRHNITGEIFVVKTTWNGKIVSSSEPIKGKLKPLDSYKLSARNNASVQAVNDRLVLMDVSGR